MDQRRRDQRQRAERLQRWIDAHHKNVSQFAKTIGMPQPQIADILAGRKPFGEKVARKIEAKAQMPERHLDGGGGPVALPSPEAAMPLGNRGDRFKFARISRGYATAEAAAQAFGVPTEQLRDWEAGGRMGMDEDLFMRFAAFFTVDPRWLAFGALPQPGNPPLLPPARSTTGTG